MKNSFDEKILDEAKDWLDSISAVLNVEANAGPTRHSKMRVLDYV